MFVVYFHNLSLVDSPLTWVLDSSLLEMVLLYCINKPIMYFFMSKFDISILLFDYIESISNKWLIEL